MDSEAVAMEFAADVTEAVANVKDLAASAQGLADTAKEAADGVAGITAPAEAAGTAIKGVAGSAAEADGALATAAGEARAAAGAYGELATAAKGAADTQGAAAAKTDTASAAAAEGGLGKYKMALVGIGVAAAVAVDGAVKYQAENTRLVTSAGESAKNLGMVQQGMLNLSSQTDESTSELSSGMYLVESAGFHGANGLTVLKAAAQGAKDEGAQLATVANGVTDALVDYHLPASQAANVTSQLIAGVSRGKTTFEEFSGSMSTILPLASSLHLSLADVTGVLAEMTSHGVGARQAADDEANAMRELMKPNAAMTKEWAAMGFNLKDVNQHLSSAGLGGTLQWLSGVAQDGAGKIGQTYNQALGKIVGTAPALQVALMTTGENATATNAAIRGIGSASADAKGNVDGFALVSQTAAFKLGAAKQATEAMGISLGEALLPAVMSVMGPITSFMQLIASNRAASIAFAIVIGGVLAGAIGIKLAGALKDAKEGVKAAGEGIEWLVGKLSGAKAGADAATTATQAQAAATEAQAAATETQVAATDAWAASEEGATVATEANEVATATATAEMEAQAVATEAMTVAKEGATVATEGLTAATAASDVAMDANPIGLIVLAIAALIAIIVLLVTHWSAVWNAVKTAAVDAWHFLDNDVFHPIMDAVDAVVKWIESHWKLLAVILATVLLGPVAGLVVFLATHWKTVIHDVEFLVNTVVGFFERLPGQILGFLERLPGDMLSIGENIVKGLINGIKSMGGFLASSIEDLVPSPIRSIVSSALGIFSPSTVFHGYGVNIVQGLINGVKSQQSALRGTMTDLAGGVSGTYAAGAIGPAAGSTSVNVSVPVTATGTMVDFTDPRYKQALQAAVQQVTLEYAQLNPTNGLTPGWGH